MSSKYYIYQMTAVTEDGTKGSYIGQHKIGRKCPLEDGYKGSGSEWKKYILQRNIPVEKVILRMCENIEEANQWEQFYIKQAKEDGIYLWNRNKGGGSHEYDKKYTDEEIAEHKKQYIKQYRDANREHRKEYYKEYYKTNKEHKRQYREANREKITEQMRQYREANREKYKQYNKQWHETNKEHKRQYNQQYYEKNKEQYKQYNKQWYETNKERKRQYDNQPCLYNGETLTLVALRERFRRAGITNPTAEAKKYIILKEQS